MVVGRKWVVVKRFEGQPKLTDFQLVSEELPPLKDGEFMARSEWVSVDPYQLAYSAQFTPPYDQFALVYATVTESRSSVYPVGAHVVCHAGYKDVWVAHESTPGPIGVPPIAAPPLDTLSPSHALGALGMPGATAYFALLECGAPSAGETVVVTGAAGAVGHLVGQIAKIKGCRVVGLAGSAEKCRLLVERLGFDAAVNYKTDDVAARLKDAAPQGVDVYFDNVGGEISSTIMNQMNVGGRVVVVGVISAYGDAQVPKASLLQFPILFNRLRVQGFLIWDHYARCLDAWRALLPWAREGRLQPLQHVTDGFENLPRAFIGMLRGDNIGKAVVKI